MAVPVIEAREAAQVPELEALLRASSRTFALSIETLSAEMREALAVAYLLLRVSDYLEDNRLMPRPRKAELLRLWAKILMNGAPLEGFHLAVAKADSRDPEAWVANNAALVLERLRALPQGMRALVVHYVRQTTLGMARWQEKGPFVEDEAELDDYMHCVAGLVGYLVTEVFARHVPAVAARKIELMPHAREYGLALQTINVIRGLRPDYERGWIYVPKSFCARAGITRTELFEPQKREQAMQVVRMLADKAEAHLEHGLLYVTALSRRHHRIRLACMWPLCFAAKTLAVSRNNPQVLAGEAKISRAEVKGIVRATSALGWSNAWLKWYYRRLLDGAQPSASGTAADLP
jgi:farnesyl-diphosphate farnesyltransferase